MAQRGLGPKSRSSDCRFSAECEGIRAEQSTVGLPNSGRDSCGNPEIQGRD